MNWTPAEQARLRKLWSRPDLSAREIGNKLGRTQGSVKKQARRLALPYRPASDKGVDTSRDNDIAKLYRDGLGVKTIALKLRMTENKVERALKRKGVTLRSGREIYAVRKHVFRPPDALPRARLSEDQITDIYDNAMYDDFGMDLTGRLDHRDRVTAQDKEKPGRLWHGARPGQSTRGMCGIVDDRPTVCQAISVKW